MVKATDDSLRSAIYELKEKIAVMTKGQEAVARDVLEVRQVVLGTPETPGIAGRMAMLEERYTASTSMKTTLLHALIMAAAGIAVALIPVLWK